VAKQFPTTTFVRQETAVREDSAPLEDILSWTTIVVTVLATAAIAAMLAFVALRY
jgi:hypothetical protein